MKHKKERGLWELYADDPEKADAELWGRGLESSSRRGFLKNSGLAALTQNVRVGCLVFCALFRSPGVLAKAATTIDHLSGGRADIDAEVGHAGLARRRVGRLVRVHEVGPAVCHRGQREFELVEELGLRRGGGEARGDDQRGQEARPGVCSARGQHELRPLWKLLSNRIWKWFRLWTRQSPS